jgi:hypothetical protein
MPEQLKLHMPQTFLLDENEARITGIFTQDNYQLN